MIMKNKLHNGIISLWKFIFAIVILLFHCSEFYDGTRNSFFFGGYIAVEFFYVVSGFFFAKNILKKKSRKDKIGEETIGFMKNTISKFIPYILIAYILSILIISYDYSFKKSELINSIWNLLLLRQFGFSSMIISKQLWFLSGLFLAYMIFCPLLKRYGRNFIQLISPLIVILGLGYLSHNWVGLDHAYHIWDKFFYTGTLRAIIEVNLGMILYVISEKIKNVEYTKIGMTFLTIMGELLLVIVLLIIQFVDQPKHYDYIMLLFMSVALLIITTQKTYDYKALSNNFVFYLEKLSMPIFINHVFMIDFVNRILKLNGYTPEMKSVVVLVLTLAFSMLELWIINSRVYKRTIHKLKKIFIREDVKSSIDS